MLCLPAFDSKNPLFLERRPAAGGELRQDKGDDGRDDDGRENHLRSGVAVGLGNASSDGGPGFRTFMRNLNIQLWGNEDSAGP
jgi:hypothetical protein